MSGTSPPSNRSPSSYPGGEAQAVSAFEQSRLARKPEITGTCPGLGETNRTIKRTLAAGAWPAPGAGCSRRRAVTFGGEGGGCRLPLSGRGRGDDSCSPLPPATGSGAGSDATAAPRPAVPVCLTGAPRPPGRGLGRSRDHVSARRAGGQTTFEALQLRPGSGVVGYRAARLRRHGGCAAWPPPHLSAGNVAGVVAVAVLLANAAVLTMDD
jgi:hypothetical protein